MTKPRPLHPHQHPSCDDAHLARCFGGKDRDYIHYHDYEWGEPVYDERQLFEMLCLEGMQAGLSWLTILKKRTAYKKLFHNFDYQKVASLSDSELEAIRQDPAIVRNHAKVSALRHNARCMTALLQQHASLADFFWRYVDHKPCINHYEHTDAVPAQTALSREISEHLKSFGFKFVGPRIIYAFMQAVGLINDHVSWCWKRAACLKKQEP